MFNKKDEVGKELHRPSPYIALFYINKKGAKTKQKLRKTRRDYAKERAKQREQMKKELASVDKLLEEGSISADIHARYKKVVEIGYAQKRRETREKHGFTNVLTPR